MWLIEPERAEGLREAEALTPLDDHSSFEVALTVGNHRCGGGIGRAQRQAPSVEDLERHLGRVTVQRRCVDSVVIVFDFAGLLHDEQRRGLRQMAFEQLVELVMHVAPGHGSSDQPDRDHDAEHQRQQAALQ